MGLQGEPRLWILGGIVFDLLTMLLFHSSLDKVQLSAVTHRIEREAATIAIGERRPRPYDSGADQPARQCPQVHAVCITGHGGEANTGAWVTITKIGIGVAPEERSNLFQEFY